MSLKDKDIRLLISLGFVFLVLLLVPSGYRSILIVILDFKDYTSYEMFKKLISLFHLIISSLLIVAGFWFGRRIDLARNYRKYLKCLFVSWVLALLFIGALWLISDDLMRNVYLVSASFGWGGYRYLAGLFSGMTLGWLVRERPVLNTEWNKKVLHYVSVYQGVVLLRYLGFSYINTVYQNSGIRPQVFGVYSQGSTLLLNIVNLWYLWRMYNAGRSVELETDYGSILWTLWVPKMVVILISAAANMIVYQETLLEWTLNLTMEIMSSPIELFETPFALLCIGYIHSRYRFLEKLEKIRQE